MDAIRLAAPLPPSPRIGIVGGGPGGLFFATLVKRVLPSAQVRVFERNLRKDAFGFGVVFSDATLRAIDEADPVLRDALRDHGRHWDRIDVWSNEVRHSFAGNGMAAIHRKTLLKLLQDNAERVCAELRFGIEAPPLDSLRENFDLVVGADGTNSTVRRQLENEGSLGHEVDTASAKFIWFGTTHLFDGLTFLHRASEHGNFAVHAYPISRDLSTFIVETDEETWRRAGMDAFDANRPPGPSDTESQAYLEELFAEDIPDGRLVANNSRWSNFRTRLTRHWWRGNVVLLGDAVHTAHFSVGSGTKMAMEDAVALAEQLVATGSGDRALGDALAEYQELRKASVGKIQGAARPSLAWWEHFGLYQRNLDPLTFCFHFFSRSIGVDKIAQRDPTLVEEVRTAWEQRYGAPALATSLDLSGDLSESPAAGDATTIGRRLRLESMSAGRALLRDCDGRSAHIPVVATPHDEAELPQVSMALPESGAVVVLGEPGLPRTLLAEEARLRRGLITVVAGADLVDEAAAETLLLAGRADAVAVANEVPARTAEAGR
jgi:anthraniloyl-CoA monooxygenase